ncbi:MAG: hypothetical protein COU07_01140 [Candidatus Harrisonbacteria bacterium CG10_big_fil_rev_8_21_14_0_10_40_38]|uniref:Uncharacterized protein n=1 Tax=Candidatus Harrisonbacteria bacterium CG10_big_fil_rev_8_21_14_0_10_40_38 TaxID=1974583 RepID=A0A2H0USV5_9BACT|nr:MAG: hypothetical protein COU07_01140 [Candidatus Harrisonbacteria bacterium CG10_big_fil_rev_8_21_14_0_10_40_38]
MSHKDLKLGHASEPLPKELIDILKKRGKKEKRKRLIKIVADIVILAVLIVLLIITLKGYIL